ncbi:hypothetical protein BMF94_1418 [Rhodotorula taiwanensis]|uniref:Protein CPL1-like domain-containing protein n=1 Tax=Rhodotorula taiwanensis TaxID=741276 RepID=A0A2S5BFG4_9BASI|nr:hypothetical protein BMF94_1418 [Rhodotorula taiwanensis]
MISAELLDHAILAAGRAGTAGNDPYVDPHRKAAARITHHREDSLECSFAYECPAVPNGERVACASGVCQVTACVSPWKPDHGGHACVLPLLSDTTQARGRAGPPATISRSYGLCSLPHLEACPVDANKLLQPQGKHEDERFSTRDLLVMGGFACIDTSRSLTSCGGCSTTGPGRDCTKIRHADGRRVLAGVATLLVAVFVLLPFAQNPGRLINRHPYSNRDGLAWELSPDHCASIGLFEDRNRADFWTVEALSAPSPRLVVRPKNDTAAGCPSLAHAMFSVWIGWAAETRLVAAPPTQGPMGVYTFSSFPPPVTSASSRGTITARFRVRLEFGYYPGGDTGQPCGAHECLPEHLEHVGIKFSGQEILDRLGSRPSLILDVASPPALAPPRVCSSLDPLPLSYRPGHDLFAFVDSTGHPCNIRRVGDQLPYSPRLRWIHFQGDSNSRYLVFELAKMLGLTASITHVETQHSNLPTTAVFHDGTGTGVVLVFRWVFLEHWDTDVDFLARVQLTSLRAFLESIPFPRSTKWPSTFLHPGLRPTDLFISFGSHAQRLSRSGFQAAVDRLRPGLARCSRLSRSTYFLLTAAAEPLDIPERFVGDELMRNNRIIDVQNDVARHFIREHFPGADIVDFFTLTRTIPRSLRLDSVHFMPDVYRVQADLIWTAIIAADERHCPP